MLRRPNEEGLYANGNGASVFEHGPFPVADEAPVGSRKPPLPISSRELGRSSPSSDGSPRPRQPRARRLTTLQWLCMAVLVLAACAGVRWFSEVCSPQGHPSNSL